MFWNPAFMNFAMGDRLPAFVRFREAFAGPHRQQALTNCLKPIGLTGNLSIGMSH